MNNKNLSNTVTWIGTAFLMKYLDLNLFGINVLPDWLGFVLLLYHMETLRAFHPDIGLLEPLAKWLLGWQVLLIISELIGGAGHELVAYIGLVMSVLWMYLQFQLLTDLADIAREHHSPDWPRLLQLRTVLTLVATAAALPLDWEGPQWYGYIMTGVFLVAVVWLLRVLFRIGEFLSPTESLSDTISFSETIKQEHERGV